MHPRISVSQICFLGESTAQLADHWRKLAPKHIGLVSPPLFAEGVAPMQAVIAEGGYGVETIAHMFHMGALSRDEALWEKVRADLKQAIDFAAALGSKSLYGLTGGRGTMNWDEAATCFAEMIATCLEPARSAGVALMIECVTPLYAHAHVATNLRDTLTLAEEAGIGVCVDTFGCWTERDLRELVTRSVKLGALIQVSDYVAGDTSLPCRAVPGDGAIPLRAIVEWALDAGYDGAFDLELLGPRIEAEGRFDAVHRATDRLSEMLVAMGV